MKDLLVEKLKARQAKLSCCSAWCCSRFARFRDLLLEDWFADGFACERVEDVLRQSCSLVVESEFCLFLNILNAERVVLRQHSGAVVSLGQCLAHLAARESLLASLQKINTNNERRPKRNIHFNRLVQSSVADDEASIESVHSRGRDNDAGQTLDLALIRQGEILGNADTIAADETINVTGIISIHSYLLLALESAHEEVAVERPQFDWQFGQNRERPRTASGLKLLVSHESGAGLGESAATEGFGRPVAVGNGAEAIRGNGERARGDGEEGERRRGNRR
jgi:hypothetical protein